MAGYLKGIILIIVLLFFITFGVQNGQPIRLNYYLEILNVELPLYGVIYISILVGIVIGMIMGINSRLSLKRTIKNLKREVEELENRVKEEKEEEPEQAFDAISQT